jgi:AAA domain/Bifunctional DNA primase/polymerase, N-terminal
MRVVAVALDQHPQSDGGWLTPLAGTEMMVALGFRVFPVKAGTKDGHYLGRKRNGKRAAGTGWKAEATSDLVTIKAWASQWPGCNWAFVCDGIIGVDEDTHHPECANTMMMLDLREEGLPPTRVHGSARGGRHWLYRLPADAPALTQRDLGPGVNVRLGGGYLMCPGSTFEGKPYTVASGVTMADAPEWMIADLLAKVTKSTAPDDFQEEDGATAKAWAIEWLAGAPRAVKGERGSTVYKAAARLREYGCSEGLACELITSLYTPLFDPPLDDAEALFSIGNAYRYAQNAAGSKSDAAYFGDLPAVLDIPQLPAPVTKSLLMDPTAGYGLNAPYLIKGVIGPRDLAFLYGPSTVGKTFLAVHLVWHLAMGKPVFGRRVKQAGVLYVNFEGKQGFMRRAELAKRCWGDPGDWLKLMTISPTLARTDVQKNGAAMVAKAISELKALTGCQYGVVVIDTLARATAGNDENSASDGSDFAGRVAAIVEATGFGVLVVHHTGKDPSKGMRGTNSAFAAADSVLAINIDAQTGVRTITAEKAKDGPAGVVGHFKLVTKVLGIDEDGDDVNSCVIEETGLSKSELDTTMTIMRDLAKTGVPLPRAHNAGVKGGSVPTRLLNHELGGIYGGNKKKAEMLLDALVTGGALLIATRAKGREHYVVPSAEKSMPSSDKSQASQVEPSTKPSSAVAKKARKSNGLAGTHHRVPSSSSRRTRQQPSKH